MVKTFKIETSKLVFIVKSGKNLHKLSKTQLKVFLIRFITHKQSQIKWDYIIGKDTIYNDIVSIVNTSNYEIKINIL